MSLKLWHGKSWETWELLINLLIAPKLTVKVQVAAYLTANSEHIIQSVWHAVERLPEYPMCKNYVDEDDHHEDAYVLETYGLCPAVYKLKDAHIVSHAVLDFPVTFTMPDGFQVLGIDLTHNESS